MSIPISCLLINDDSTTEALKRWLRAEASRLGPGQRLPATRAITAARHVSPLTVSRALADLSREGVLVTRPGAGTYAAGLQHRQAGDPAGHWWQTVALADRAVDTAGLSPLADPPQADDVISLAAGYLHPSLMPQAALRAALARAARLPDAWDRPPTAGLPGLRSWFAQAAAPGFDARDVLITSGGQSALSAVFRALVPAGAPLLVESPTYPGALAVARAAGLRPVPVPADADGVIPVHLAEAFGRTGAQAVYCQPTYHNPTGAVLAAARRSQVLGAAAAAGAFVVEDDFARWLPHAGQAPPPLLAADDEGRVVYLTSLTKAASPSLRIGAIIARGPVADRLRALRAVDDLFVARPLQEAALELVSRTAWPRHLRTLSQVLGSRAATLASAVSRLLPAVGVQLPRGGMHLWARLPAGTDDVAAAEAARGAGVVVMPGRPFFPAEPPGPYLRLAFCGAASEAELVTAVSRMAGAIA
jgi:DNA-binding transcriptional MocR family regulator